MRLKWLETVEMVVTTCDATVSIKKPSYIALFIYSQTQINDMLPENRCICTRVVATDILEVFVNKLGVACTIKT